MAKPEMTIEDLFEEKARAGDGTYAIALALLKLADIQADDSRSRSLASRERVLGLESIAQALHAQT
ncbi:MAG: hypothetical protein WD928_04925 [Gammaproteobacteria bacterium]